MKKWIVLIVGLIFMFVGTLGFIACSDRGLQNGVIVDKGYVGEYRDDYGQRHGAVYWFVIDDLDGCRWTKFVSAWDWTTHFVGDRYNIYDAVLYFGDEGIVVDFQSGRYLELE